MRRIFRTADVAQAVLLKDKLVHDGIAAWVRQTAGSSYFHASASNEGTDVWVADDADDAEVHAIVADFVRAWRDTSAVTSRSWRCRACKEENPDPFHSCWKCGRDRRAASANGEA